MTRRARPRGAAAPIRVGIGGWDFAPWRGTFFPAGLPASRQLHHASRALTSIEVNATFYRTQSAETYRQWHAQTPDDFVFSLKAHRAATQRRDLAGVGDAVRHFLQSGMAELGGKLGAINWQLLPSRRFDADTIRPFLDLLPSSVGGVALRHAIEAAHPSFASDEAGALLAERGVARTIVETPEAAGAAPNGAPFVYARLKANALDATEGYDSHALDGWAAAFRDWAAAGRPCFVYFIAGDKVRAPDAARALLHRLNGGAGAQRLSGAALAPSPPDPRVAGEEQTG